MGLLQRIGNFLHPPRLLAMPQKKKKYSTNPKNKVVKVPYYAVPHTDCLVIIAEDARSVYKYSLLA